MKKTLLFLGMVAIFAASCKKGDLKNEQLGATATTTKKALSAGDGVWDLLGFGYDISGEYGNSSASKFQVIDILRLNADHPDRVTTDLSKTQSGTVTSGDNAQSLSEGLSAKLTLTAGFKFFGTTVTTSYADTSSFNSKYAYGSYNLIIQEKRVKFNADSTVLQNYLTPAFVSDVQTMTPEQIVQRYGTHILSDCILGAKLQVLYQSQTANQDRKTAASAGLKFNVTAIFNISTSATGTYNTSSASSNTSEKIQYITHGGNPNKSLIGTVTFGSNSTTSPTPVTVNIADWQSSSTEANAELIDIGQDGLIPIASLIANPTKAAQVRDYIYNTWYPAHQTAIRYNVVPLYRYHYTINNDHLLTTNLNEVGGAANWGIDFNGNRMGYVYTEGAKPGLIPIYKYLINDSHTHFYTTNYAELGGGGSYALYEGILGYVNQYQVAGSTPIYRYNGGVHGHMYTVDYNELGGGSQGYSFEWIMNYLQIQP